MFKQSEVHLNTCSRCKYMNMFARFDENPAMILQDIKETKRYGLTDTRTDGQRENSIPTTNKVWGGGGGGGYNKQTTLSSRKY